MTSGESGDAVRASTACWTAAVRALEHARPDLLFEDPWAESLAGDAGSAWITRRTAQSVIPIVLRTRYFDDVLRRIASGRTITQIVMLAAGLDTRAYRLEWPEDMRIYELDQPDVLERKERVLSLAGTPERTGRPFNSFITAR